MHPAKKLIAGTALALALALPAQAAFGQDGATSETTATTPSDEAVEAALSSAMKRLEADGFSGFAMIARGGEPVAFANAGAADAATGRRFDLDTQFDIGSISKPFTGLAIATLEGEGRLRVDDTLADYFEDVPADKAAITIEQLMTHTAGFGPGHGGDLVAMDREQMLAEVFGAQLRSVPGERYAYSNTGPSLAAAIIEQVTGRTYEEYLVDEVLAPLGIASTGYHAVHDPARTDVSSRYGPVLEASWGGLDPVSWALVGNGGMVSSARDLARLGDLIATGQIEPSVLESWTARRVEEPGGTWYGLGIGQMEMEGVGQVIWHNGGNPAFQTEWWVMPDLGLTMLLHRNDGPVSIAQAMGPVLTATTGIEMAFADGSADFEITPSDTLPETPAGALGSAFLTALDGDEAGWMEFVRGSMSPALLEQLPEDRHLQMFSDLGAEIAGRRLSGYSRGEGELRLQLTSDELPPMFLVLLLDEEGSAPTIRGIGVM